MRKINVKPHIATKIIFIAAAFFNIFDASLGIIFVQRDGGLVNRGVLDTHRRIIGGLYGIILN